MSFIPRFVTGFAAVLLLGSPSFVYAQTAAGTASAPAAPAPLSPADATPLLGAWTIAAEGQQGPLAIDLVLKMEAGKVVGEITVPALEKTPVTDITKAGTAVILRYVFDYQGNGIPAKVTLTPAGETMAVVFEFADGAFTMNGTASRKKV